MQSVQGDTGWHWLLRGGLVCSSLWLDGSSPGNPGQSQPTRRGTVRSGIIPTSRIHSPLLLPTRTLAVVTSCASPCTKVTQTVSPTSTVWGKTDGWARVIMLLESGRAFTGQPASRTCMMVFGFTGMMQSVSHSLGPGPRAAD